MVAKPCLKIEAGVSNIEDKISFGRCFYFSFWIRKCQMPKVNDLWIDECHTENDTQVIIVDIIVYGNKNENTFTNWFGLSATRI